MIQEANKTGANCEKQEKESKTGYRLIFLTVNIMRVRTMSANSPVYSTAPSTQDMHYIKLVTCTSSPSFVPIMPKKVRRDNLLVNISGTQYPESAAEYILPCPTKSSVVMQSLSQKSFHEIPSHSGISFLFFFKTPCLFSALQYSPL